LAGRREGTQSELRQTIRYASAVSPVSSAFHFPNLFRFDDMPGFSLETGLQFIGQSATSPKPIQSLAASFRAPYSDSTRVMPQIYPTPPEKNLFKVFFQTSQGEKTLAQGLRFFF
jgi:hypothetical protein